MRKGQAFDTFKLMIAAVIAVAILGILLGILGGITIATTSFDESAKQLLTKASGSPGAVFPSSGEVQFNKDSIYPPSIFEATVGGRTVELKCGTSITGTLCKEEGTSLIILSDFRQKIYAVCGMSSSDSCCVSVGETITSINDC